LKTRDLTLCAMMVALLAIFSQFVIPIGPVAITLQTFIVYLIGSLLTPKNAFITTLSYLILGLVGVPVFAGFNGGFQSLLLPSFGFILSWIPATTVQAWFLDKSQTVGTKKVVLSNLLNYVITYIGGLAYMSFIISGGTGSVMGFSEILWIGLLPFLPGDILKIFVATLFTKRLRGYIQNKEQATF